MLKEKVNPALLFHKKGDKVYPIAFFMNCNRIIFLRFYKH